MTLIHDGTRSERSAMTNQAGVRVALPGFKTEERTHVRIATRQPALMEFILEVAAVSHEIPEES